MRERMGHPPTVRMGHPPAHPPLAVDFTFARDQEAGILKDESRLQETIRNWLHYSTTRTHTPGSCAGNRPEAEIRLGPVHDACARGPVYGFAVSRQHLADLASLDAGAGVGALSCAFLDRWAVGDGFTFQKAEVEAYEIDKTLRAHLETTLAATLKIAPYFQVISGDFIGAACRSLRVACSPTRF